MKIEVTSPKDLDDNYYQGIFEEIEAKLKAEVSEAPNQSYYDVFIYRTYDSKTISKIREVYEEAGWENLVFYDKFDTPTMEDNVTRIELRKPNYD